MYFVFQDDYFTSSLFFCSFAAFGENVSVQSLFAEKI